jgi:hypothetical protein
MQWVFLPTFSKVAELVQAQLKSVDALGVKVKVMLCFLKLISGPLSCWWSWFQYLFGELSQKPSQKGS